MYHTENVLTRRNWFNLETKQLWDTSNDWQINFCWRQLSCTRQEFNYSCDDDQQFDLTLHACTMVSNIWNHNEDDDSKWQNGDDDDSHACTMCRQCWPSRKYRLPPGMDGNMASLMVLVTRIRFSWLYQRDWTVWMISATGEAPCRQDTKQPSHSLCEIRSDNSDNQAYQIKYGVLNSPLPLDQRWRNCSWICKKKSWS